LSHLQCTKVRLYYWRAEINPYYTFYYEFGSHISVNTIVTFIMIMSNHDEIYIHKTNTLNVVTEQ
jgi:hypothetical protein